MRGDRLLLLIVKIKINPPTPRRPSSVSSVRPNPSIKKVTLHFLSDHVPRDAAAVPCQWDSHADSGVLQIRFKMDGNHDIIYF